MSGSIELVALEPRAIFDARRAFERQMLSWGCVALADSLLVFSELVTNAVVHGGGASRIVVSFEGSTVCINVHDHIVGGLAERGPSDPLGGHGLSIVDQLSQRWGWQPTATGKRVWAELRCGI